MKAHRFDAWSFAGGVILVALGLLILIPDTVDLLALRFDTFFDLILPILALVVGAALVIPALRRRTKGEEPQPLTQDERSALDELNQSAPPVG